MMRKLMAMIIALAALVMMQSGYAMTKQEAEAECRSIAIEQGMSGEELNEYVAECVMNLVGYEEEKPEKE